MGNITFNAFQENPLVMLDKDKIEWPNGKTPLDSPPCGFDGAKCKLSSTSATPAPNRNANIGKFGNIMTAVSLELTSPPCFVVVCLVILDPGGGGTWVNFCWVCAAGLSEPLPHCSLFCDQL